MLGYLIGHMTSNCEDIISISYCRWTHTMCCLKCRVLYTEVDAKCNKLAKAVDRTLTVRSAVNLIRLRTVTNWFITLCVHLC